MFWWRKDRPCDQPGYKKNLRDYTNQELMDFLNKNNDLQLEFLSGITSEVVRRLWDHVLKYNGDASNMK